MVSSMLALVEVVLGAALRGRGVVPGDPAGDGGWAEVVAVVVGATGVLVLVEEVALVLDTVEVLAGVEEVAVGVDTATVLAVTVEVAPGTVVVVAAELTQWLGSQQSRRTW